MGNEVDELEVQRTHSDFGPHMRRARLFPNSEALSRHPPRIKPQWALVEEATLAYRHSQLGNRWTAIARYLPGRSENDVKNMWHSTGRTKSCRRGSLLFAYNRAVRFCADDPVARRAAYEWALQHCGCATEAAAAAAAAAPRPPARSAPQSCVASAAQLAQPAVANGAALHPPAAGLGGGAQEAAAGVGSPEPKHIADVAAAPRFPSHLQYMSGSSTADESHFPTASRLGALTGELRSRCGVPVTATAAAASEPGGMAGTGGGNVHGATAGASDGGTLGSNRSRLPVSSTGMFQPQSQPQPQLLCHPLSMQNYCPRRSLSRPVGRAKDFLSVDAQQQGPAGVGAAENGSPALVAATADSGVVKREIAHPCASGLSSCTPAAAAAAVGAPPPPLAPPAAAPPPPAALLQQPTMRSSCVARLAQLVLGGPGQDADGRPMGQCGAAAGVDVHMEDPASELDPGGRSAVLAMLGASGALPRPSGGGGGSETGMLTVPSNGSLRRPTSPGIAFRRVHNVQEARSHRFLASADSVAAVATSVTHSPPCSPPAGPSPRPATRRTAALLAHAEPDGLRRRPGGTMHRNAGLGHGLGRLRTEPDWDLLISNGSEGMGAGGGVRGSGMFSPTAGRGGLVHADGALSSELSALMEQVQAPYGRTAAGLPAAVTLRPVGRPGGCVADGPGRGAGACTSCASRRGLFDAAPPNGPSAAGALLVGMALGLGGTAAPRAEAAAPVAPAQPTPFFLLNTLCSTHSGSSGDGSCGDGKASGGRAGPLLRLPGSGLGGAGSGAATAATAAAVGMSSLWLPGVTDAAVVMGMDEEDLLDFADGN